MAQEIAHGVVKIEAHDTGAIAALRRVDAEYDRTMRSIDGKEAEVRITGNVKDLKRALREAEAETRAHEARIAALQEKYATEASRGKKSAITREINQRQALIDNIEKEAASVRKVGAAAQNHLETLKRTNAEQGIATQKVKTTEAAVKRVNRERENAIRLQERETRAVSDTALAISKMEQQYVKAQDRLDSIRKRQGKFTTKYSPATSQRVDIEERTALAEMEVLKAKLNAMGRQPPVTIHTKLDSNNMLARWFASLTEATVRIGPFTTTIAGLAKSLLLLGPIIMGVVGAVGALTGAIGAGLVGALGVAAAGITGFLLAAGGIFAIVKPLVKDFMDAKKATDAYNKAVREHGKGSEEAAKKMEILDNVLGDVPAKTRRQFIEMGKLNDQWKKLTQSARPEFWRLMGDGIETVSDMMPMFARRSTEAFSNVSQGLRGWMHGLRSTEGQGVISAIFGNFNRAIPSLMSGLGSLGAAIGRVTASFSRYLLPVGNAFKRWAEGLNQSASNTTKLNASVDRTANAFKSTWHFISAATRVLFQFFRAGVGPGGGMMDDMADSLNRTADGMASLTGQQKLSSFFSDSIDTAKKLWGAIAPLAKLFIEFTTIMRPMTNIALQFAGALVSIAHDLAAFGPLKFLMQAAFGVFLTRALVGRISAVGAGITGLITRYRELRTASTALNALPGPRPGTAGIPLGGAAPRTPATSPGGVILPGGGLAAENEKVARSAERAAQSTGKLAAAGRGLSKAGSAAMNLGTALTGIPGPLLAIGAAAGVAVGAMIGLDRLFNSGKRKAWQHVHDLEDTVQRGIVGVARSNTRYMEARDALGQFGSSVLHANQNLREAKKALDGTKKGTQEYRDALLAVRDAQRENAEASKDYYENRDRMYAGATNQLQNARAAVQANKDEIASLKERAKEGGVAGKVAEMQLKVITGRTAGLNEQLAAAQNRYAALPIQAARGLRGLAALTGQAETAFGRLARMAGGKKIAATIGIKYEDPRKAGQAATAARSALQSGVSKGAVMRIVADSRSADEALRRLKAARITPKKLTILEEGGQKAINMMERIIGRKLSKKEQKIVQDGGPAVIALLEKINHHKLPKKVQQVTQQGVQAVITGLTHINGFPLHDKSVRVSLVDDITAGLAAVQRAINSLHGKTVGVGKHGYGGGIVEAHAKGASFLERAQARAEAKNFQRTHGGKYNSPTLLVGEEDRREYVIATNPAYRENNKRYLAEAADEFGMTIVDSAFTGARAAKKKPKHSHNYNEDYRGGKKGNRGIGPHRNVRNPLPVVTNQSLTSDYIPEHYQQTTTKRAADERSINSYDKQLADANETYRNTTKGPSGNRARQRIAKKIEHLKRLRAGVVRDYGAHKKAQKEAAGDYRDYSKYKNNIEQWTTAMNTDATRYNNTEDPNAAAPFLTDWKALKAKRETALEKLVKLLTAVRKKAPKKYQAAIDAEIKGALDEHATSEYEEAPTGVEPGAEKTFEDLIKEYGKSGTLSDSIAALAVARTDEDPENDLAAAAKVRDVYKEILDRALAANADSDPSNNVSSDLITEAANAYTSARDEAQSADSASGGTADGLSYGGQQAIVDTLRGDVLRSFGGNMASIGGSGMALGDPLRGSPQWTQQNPASLGAFGTLSGTGGAGTIGGETQTAQKIINQTNNFQQPPADSHTWSQGIIFELGAAL